MVVSTAQSPDSFVSPLAVSYPQQHRPQGESQGGPSSMSVRAVNEYYSSVSLSLAYSSGDGDTVEISMQSIEYGKSVTELNSRGQEMDLGKVADHIRQTLENMRKHFFENMFSDELGTEQVTESDETQAGIGIPEYWNAENTSQRIVDFALSFFESFKGEAQEFLSIINGAVDEGFEQAREMMGELSKEVGALINKTHTLITDKFSVWVSEQSSEEASPSEETA